MELQTMFMQIVFKIK